MDGVRIELLAHSNASVAGAIHAVQMAAYALEARLLGATCFPPLERTRADIQASKERFFGVFLGEVLVGSLGLEPGEQQNEINISSLVVAPDHQRMGIGRRLLARALNECGNHTVTVSTAAGNTWALRLYASFGFVECSRRLLGPEALEVVKLRRTR